MSRGSTGGGGNAPTTPTSNPMPALTAEVRRALVASIKEFGVVCPVIKDQTGFVLDGYNRIAITAELGVPCPEIIYTCTPDQREILRMELNGARRQLKPEQWKPLVDHLRSLTLSDGSKYSDRSIAQAVGVSAMTVSRYKPPQKSGVTRGTPSTKTVGKDGVAQNKNPQWTAPSRALHLIKQSTTGLTAADLRNDSILSGFGHSTVSKVPTELSKQGLIEKAGMRDRSAVWKAVANPVPPPKRTPTKTVARKAEQIVEGLKDERVREAVKQTVAQDKDVRQAGTVLRAAERELEAARLNEEKREAESERERLRLIEIARSHADKSVKTWDKLITEVRAAWTIIAAYSAHLDDLPALHAAFERTLDRELDELRRQMDWLDKKLHPGGNRNPVQAGTIIDVKEASG